MADQLAIYDATLACRQVFQDLGAVPILEEWAENRLADLNLWANGAGALKVGKASLDARLSSNLDAKIFVVNLLRMLQGFVEKCAELGSKVHNDTPETSELSQAIQDVNDILGQLSRITISIRQAGTHARIQKADASYDPGHPQIRALSQHLQLLLLAKPSKDGALQARASSQGIGVLLCRDDTTVIDSHSLTATQQRLIEANLKRRNRFLYAQRHAMKLSDRDQPPSTSIPASRKLVLPPVINTLKRTAEEHGVPKAYSATTATEVQDPIALPTQASAQPATTVISAISSRVTYPRPPPLRSDQNVFKCPCCCQTLSTSMSRGSQWKKHISRDILPYTCILEDCPYPEKLYHTKGLWLSHMFTDHGGLFHWVCLACNDSSARPVFYEKSAFIEHLEGSHSRGIKPQQIPMLVSAWKRETSVSIHYCPLCGFEDQDSDAVLNHTAEHLHSFSLRSLPWPPGEEESDDGLYNGYYEEHPYFNTGSSVGTESERSRSTMSSEQRNLEELPAMGSGGETTENNRLTEEKIRDILKHPNDKKVMLDAFLNGIENQESFQEPSPLANVGNLGSVLDSLSKYKAAEAMHRQALELRTKVLGPEHPNTLTSLSQLSFVLAGQGKFHEAEAMHRQALEIHTKVLGPEHPNTLTSLSQLGLVLADQGKFQEAEAMHRQASELRTKVLGPEHPDTLTSLSQLGLVLADQGKFQEAEAMHRQALELHTKVLGPEHPNTLNCVGHLGSVLASQGKYKEAETMHRQALELYTKVLGPEHPNTLISLSQLGSILAYQGKYQEAEAMQEQVLEGYKKGAGIFRRVKGRDCVGAEYGRGE
ncbi:hypothetical protein BJX76DRAFT_34859 [Aspergillus varians]